MKVRVDSYAWFSKQDLSGFQLAALRKELTVLPQKAKDYQDEEPKPIAMYSDTVNEFGVAREYFLERRQPRHEVVFNTTLGSKDWMPAEFNTDDFTLRLEQQQALAAVQDQVSAGAHGGIVRAVPGWGKCSHYTTELYDVDKGRVQIGEQVGKELRVASCDLHDSGRVVAAVTSKVWGSGHKSCRKLLLASGQYLRASFDHPVLTPRGFVELADLKPGDLVAVARRLPPPLKPLVVTDAEVLVCAALLADGCSLHHNQALYCKGKSDLVETVEKALTEILGFGGSATEHKGGAWYLSIRGLLPWIRSLGIAESSKSKRVPGQWYCLANDQLALLIRWLFTDGSVYVGEPRKIEITLASEGLIDDLQTLLRRFGICARKAFKKKSIKQKDGTKKWYAAWRLQIADAPSLRLFLSEIGDIPGLESECEELRAQLQLVLGNTNWDVVPIQREQLAEIQAEDTTGVWARPGGLGAGSFMGRDCFRRLCEESGYAGKYRWYADSDLVWEKISSVTDLGECPVYDIEVPSTHNFVANGVVTHNTVLGCAVIASLRMPTLVVVHKDFLMDQWRKRICGDEEEGIPPLLPGASVGLVQQNVCDFRGRTVVLAMVHSLAARQYEPELYSWPGLIIADEVHRMGAYTWAPVPAKFPARFRLGLSATPRRKDGADKVFFYHIGPVIFSAKEKRLEPKIKRVWTKFKLVKTERFNPNLAKKPIILRFLCASVFRNRLIVNLMIEALKKERKLIVLSERLNHLDALHELLREMWPSNFGSIPSVGYYVGGRTKRQLAEASRARVVFATWQFASEGLDIPALDTLFMATPMSDVVQGVGRILRPCEGKKDPVVVDFRDDEIPLFERMGKTRDKQYAKILK